ncbi:MAG: alpha/beta hydrolase [Brevirhabdus sp.]
MRRFGRWIGRLVLVVAGVAAALWVLGPYEPVDREITFDAAALGDDPEAYVKKREAAYDDIIEGAQKEIIWAGEKGAVTPVSVVYLHGFSATQRELRPVPEMVAKGLGANLFFTRLAGHGRGGAAMAEPTAGDWIEDLAEALAIGRKLGQRVVVIATSTGGTLAALAAVDPALNKDIAGIAFISPNFEIANPAAALLTLPAARYWVPLVAGAERSFEPGNAQQAAFWTTRYPTVSVLPMAALVKHARNLDYGTADIPALFVFSDADRVVKASATRAVAESWGAPVVMAPQTPGDGDDEYAHVLAGDIMSPGLTQGVAAKILSWAGALGQN